MDERKNICEIGRRLAEKGFIAATDGNISCKIAPNKILITPTGVPKGELNPIDIVVIDLSGRVVSGKNKPSGEMFTHLAVYNSRPDVKAVVHAHLPHVTALSVAGIKLDKAVLPETFVMMGNISTASYATPSSYEGAAAIKKVIKNSNAVILDRHGAMAFGSSLNEAYNRLEKLEHTAKVAALAKMMGRVKYLNRHQVKKLKELKGKLYGTKR